MREIYFNPASYSKLFGEEKKQEDINAMMYSVEQKGLEKGMEKGVEKGQAEAMIKAAKNLLKSNVSIDVISSATNLTYDQINELKAENYSQ